MEYSRYQSPIHLPNYVEYWDRMFLQTEAFFDWKIMFAIVEAARKDVAQKLDLNVEQTIQVVWRAYCAAVSGDESSPFYNDYLDFGSTIEPSVIPTFVMLQSVGLDIAEGLSETEAIEAYKGWLLEHPENGLFGHYKMLPDLSVLRVP